MQKDNRAAQVKNYITELFAVEDSILVQAREEAKKAGLPAIHISAQVGKLLYCLTKMHQPEKVLEIGTLAGYSAIWIARGLSSTAKLISLEFDELHALIARRNIEAAGLQHLVEIRAGHATRLMDALMNEAPFDLVFIDADKEQYPLYLEKALLLTKPGSVILSDNLIPREEKIGSPNLNDLEASSIYRFNQMIATHPKLESILIPTIMGHNGRMDALGLSIVKEEV